MYIMCVCVCVCVRARGVCASYTQQLLACLCKYKGLHSKKKNSAASEQPATPSSSPLVYRGPPPTLAHPHTAQPRSQGHHQYVRRV